MPIDILSFYLDVNKYIVTTGSTRTVFTVGMLCIIMRSIKCLMDFEFRKYKYIKYLYVLCVDSFFKIKSNFVVLFCHDNQISLKYKYKLKFAWFTNRLMKIKDPD